MIELVERRLVGLRRAEHRLIERAQVRGLQRLLHIDRREVCLQIGGVVEREASARGRVHGHAAAGECPFLVIVGRRSQGARFRIVCLLLQCRLTLAFIAGLNRRRASRRRLLLERVAPGSASLVLLLPISRPSCVLALHPDGLDLIAHGIGTKHLFILGVKILAALGDVDQVLEEEVALQLHLDHIALLLLRELKQVHHHESRLVVLEVHT